MIPAQEQIIESCSTNGAFDLEKFMDYNTSSLEAVAEHLQRVNTALELQNETLEKMKCCGNCKNCDSIDRAPICYVYESKDNLAWDICEKWEIR